MTAVHFVDVFSETPCRGNALAVFHDADDLSDEQMAAMARWTNLSETTFLCAPTHPGADYRVRIWTTGGELPFAGHPTLGTAAVVGDLAGGRAQVVLSMPAGLIPVQAEGTSWTLRANAPTTGAVEADPADLARMVGLAPSALADAAQWVDTGNLQMLLPLRSATDVRAASADPALLRRFATRPDEQVLVYLWAPREDGDLEARLFFTQNGAVIEDPATGSACANLGGWFQARGERGISHRIHQGAAVHRPSLLQLEVDGDGAVLVSGTVSEVARGVYRL
jgi:trans-2,3-dihydro-3-hydroxyanthranilate isomerase